MNQKFTINIEPSILTDLKNRLANTRWTNEIENAGWQYGTNLGYLRELCSFWQNDFDWPKCENYLNSFAHFKTSVKTSEYISFMKKAKVKMLSLCF